MNKTQMTFNYQDWFESYCNSWVDHYNFMLSLSYLTPDEEVWYQDRLNECKIYDV
jgi:hypothetical protein